MLIIELLYLLSATLLAIYGLNSMLYAWLYWRHSLRETTNNPAKNSFDRLDDYPTVTVQLPVYNERHVVTRLIDTVAKLDWPADRLQIQVLDDSDDDTQQIIAAAVAPYRETPLKIAHIRRADRSGFKAGALQYGLQSATGEFVTIFDADFVPPTDFLQRTMPYFAEPQVGCVQTRWGHVNPDTSLLTRAQAAGIDGHFIVEQQARHNLGAYLNFNGTAGIWRRACMDDAGGWEGDTLTEDLDLSYRAQLADWQIYYQSDIVVPAELPVQIDAFKRQQFRWAKGSLQTAQKLLGRVWQVSDPLWRKMMGTLHLTNYAVHPLMILNLLLILPMSFSDSYVLWMAPFLTLTAAGPPAMYWAAMGARSFSWATRLRRLAILVALGTGLSVNNTRAAFEAFTGIRSDFMRTPKFAITETTAQWQTSNYALPRDPTAWVELGLAIYAIWLLFFSINLGVWWMVFWLVLYSVSYSYIAFLAFSQAWQMRTLKASQASMPAVE
ncbi:MAG: glycosyltransferase [Chloroflexota bacterium]